VHLLTVAEKSRVIPYRTTSVHSLKLPRRVTSIQRIVMNMHFILNFLHELYMTLDNLEQTFKITNSNRPI